MEKDETKNNHWQVWSEGILTFHGQLNWYIFHAFHNKNEFHIHWVDYHFLWYIWKDTLELFLFH